MGETKHEPCALCGMLRAGGGPVHTNLSVDRVGVFRVEVVHSHAPPGTAWLRVERPRGANGVLVCGQCVIEALTPLLDAKEAPSAQ